MQTSGTCSHVVLTGAFSDMRPRSTAQHSHNDHCVFQTCMTDSELVNYAYMTRFTPILTSKLLLNCTDRRVNKLIPKLQMSRDKRTSNTTSKPAHHGASTVFIVICLSPRLLPRGPLFARSTPSS